MDLFKKCYDFDLADKYKDAGIYYGADLDMYRAFPRIIPIYDWETKEVLDIFTFL